MKHLNPMCGANGQPFKYTPSWQSNRPGYLAEKFRKIQKELEQQKRANTQSPEEQ